MEFGKKLRDLRQIKGLTQQEVADEVGITLRAYVAYELKNSKPRKRVTYELLSKALDCDINYLLSDDDQADASQTTSDSIASENTAKAFGPLTSPVSVAYNLLYSNITDDTSEHNNESIQQDTIAQRQFRSIAWDLILTCLTNKDTDYRIGNITKYKDSILPPDKFLILNGQNIDEWWFKFWANSKKADQAMSKYLSANACFLFSSFAALNPDPKRKISIVVEDEILFNEMHKLKDCNSYRGNMSVILLDSSWSRVKKEVLLSHYDRNDTMQYISIV